MSTNTTALAIIQVRNIKSFRILRIALSDTISNKFHTECSVLFCSKWIKRFPTTGIIVIWNYRDGNNATGFYFVQRNSSSSTAGILSTVAVAASAPFVFGQIVTYSNYCCVFIAICNALVFEAADPGGKYCFQWHQ